MGDKGYHKLPRKIVKMMAIKLIIQAIDLLIIQFLPKCCEIEVLPLIKFQLNSLNLLICPAKALL